MKRAFGLLFVMCLGSNCDDARNVSEDFCGPCGSVSAGEGFISGDARIDGLFKSIGTIGSATAQIEVDLEEDLLTLARAFEVQVTGDMSLEAIATAVRSAIDVEISANVQGDIQLDFVPPQCQAAVDMAVEAQAHCEAQAGCEVSAECEGADVAVSCAGTCSGECSGTCTGGCVVEVSGSCEGTCTGACQLEVGGACDGICRGECDGECSLTNTAGDCEGSCSGQCTGSCELKAGGSCTGTCHGECETTADAACEGKCHGSCSAQCSGGCEGEATPPSCSAEGSCEATADCQASAKAQGSANLQCTPPTLTFRYDLKAEVDGNTRAAFVAKMAALKVHMMGIVQGMFKMRALIDPDYAAELGIEPPLGMTVGQLQILFESDLDSLDLPPGRFACVLSALEESMDIISNMAFGLGYAYVAQLEIISVFDIL